MCSRIFDMLWLDWEPNDSVELLPSPNSRNLQGSIMDKSADLWSQAVSALGTLS